MAEQSAASFQPSIPAKDARSSAAPASAAGGAEYFPLPVPFAIVGRGREADGSVDIEHGQTFKE